MTQEKKCSITGEPLRDRAYMKNGVFQLEPWPRSGNYQDPTPEMLDNPLWNAIWEEIKHWDINVPSEYNGYMNATGNHATAIFMAITQAAPRWRCFHCEFATSNFDEAYAHFGDRDDAEEFKPICKWWSNMDEAERRAQFQSIIQELNEVKAENELLATPDPKETQE